MTEQNDQPGIDWRAKLDEILSKPRTKTSADAPVIDEQALYRALAEVERIVNGEEPNSRILFEPSLKNDGTYEYTSTGSCDGTQTWNLRRTPAVRPGAWEEITEIPEGAKYDDER